MNVVGNLEIDMDVDRYNNNNTIIKVIPFVTWIHAPILKYTTKVNSHFSLSV